MVQVFLPQTILSTTAPLPQFDLKLQVLDLSPKDFEPWNPGAEPSHSVDA